MSRRPRQAMPDDVAAALARAGRRGDYDARPAYQRNDYLGWLNDARSPETRARRLARMLEELKEGGVYMGMPHRPSAKDKA